MGLGVGVLVGLGVGVGVEVGTTMGEDAERFIRTKAPNSGKVVGGLYEIPRGVATDLPDVEIVMELPS